MERTVRERAEKYGVESLFDIEAFSLLIGVKQEMLQEFQSMKELKEGYEKLNISRLQRQKLEAFFELCKRVSSQMVGEVNKIVSQYDAYKLVKWDMVDLQREEFRVILLNAKCKVISTRKISEGSLSSSIVHPREVFKEAILQSAYSLIAVHNHPSGDPSPSKEDIQITTRLKQVGETIGIPLIDHVIVAKEGYTSLKEEGHI